MVRVGFDLDGILANAVHTMNLQLGRPEASQPYWLPNNWDWLGIDFGMSKEDTRKAWKEYFNGADTFRNMETLPGLTSLVKFRWDMWEAHKPVEYYYISNRSGPTAIEQTRDWLNEYHLLDGESTYLITAKKGLAARLLGLDYFIEDNLDNALDVTASTSRKCYLLDTPYNQCDGPTNALVYRVKTVDEYLNDIRRYVEVS